MRDVFVRLEPRTRSADIEPGLAARVWDAAWLLGRQWVFGEFDGEDAGTPVVADVEVTSYQLEAVELGGKARRYNPLTAPLEPLVEGAPPRPAGWTLRCKLEAGVLLARTLYHAGHQSLLNLLLIECRLDDHATPGQPVADALRQLALGRVPDGEMVYRAVRSGAGWTTAALDLMTAWADDVERRFAPASPDVASSWVPHRLEYRFAVQAAGLPESLEAEAHHGADLDWYSFDLGKTPGAGDSAVAPSTRHRAVPTPIRFAGMPEPRHWTFEKTQVDLGAIEASASDLARMAVLQFAFDYGNDSLVLPLRLAVGSVHRIVHLTVSDTFGHATRLLPAARKGTALRQGWSFLAPLTAAGAPSDLLFIPPVAAHAQRGVDLQDVRLMRDEMANLVWGIEYTVEGETAAPLDRAQALDRQRPQTFTAPTAGDLRYVLQTRVPANWFALELLPSVPRLLRLALVSPSTENPTASLLRSVQRTDLHEEEVPREGVHLREAHMMARWFGGSTVTWRRIERTVGRGEGSSGLQFDLATTQR